MSVVFSEDIKIGTILSKVQISVNVCVSTSGYIYTSTSVLLLEPLPKIKISGKL